MILSFHPCVVSDENRICAGREPDVQDLAAIQRATAVILPQGCPESLYRMARDHCPHLFPNHGPRFAYPDKIAQIQLFRKYDAAIPHTRCFSNLDAYIRSCPDMEQPPLDFPLVIKMNWGGEGETVFPVADACDLERVLARIARFEKTGQKGFLAQDLIHTRPKGCALRVVVIGERLISYWRLPGNSNQFYSTLSLGARIDHTARPALQRRGIEATKIFSTQTGINLAGFDLIFRADSSNPAPYFLEINYFFGRRGLGGSERFYQYLNQEVTAWLAHNGLQ